MLASSAAFALVHLNPPGAFVIGLVMCGLYAKTQSLWAPCIAHGVFNLMLELSVFVVPEDDASSVGGPSVDELLGWIQSFTWPAVGAVGIGVVFAVWFVLRSGPVGSWQPPTLVGVNGVEVAAGPPAAPREAGAEVGRG
jgi:hypothetical protein